MIFGQNILAATDKQPFPRKMKIRKRVCMHLIKILLDSYLLLLAEYIKAMKLLQMQSDCSLLI
jgi:hypothetical protein